MSITKELGLTRYTEATRARFGRFLVVALLAGLMFAGPDGSLAAEPAPASPDRSPTESTAKDYFDIREFRVLGNSVLPPRSVERAIYPFAGPHKTIDDVQAARSALEAAYHEAGYGTVFVDIPEQDVGEGIVRLHAAEGRLDRVRITGLRYFSGRRILAELPAARTGEVPSLPELQKELAAVNGENADRSVAPILKAGRTPGTVDVEFKGQDSLPLHGGVTLNDRYSPDTSALRTTVDLSYGNLFDAANSLAFEYQTAPEHPPDARVVSLTYVAPLGSNRDLVALFAIDTHSDVAAVGTLALLGVGQVYGAHYIHAFEGASATFNQNLNFGADLKVFTQTVDVSGSAPDRTPIRYINWSLVYSLGAHGPTHDTTFTLGADFGFRGLENDQAQFDYKRYMAQADYVYLRGSVDHRQSLPHGFSLDFRGGFQLADGPLVSNEQFGVGGIDTVRGYPESLELGDDGATASIELRGPTWTWGGHADDHIGLFAFFDAGLASILDPLMDQQSRFELEGAGAGLRVLAFHGLDGTLDWAEPLRSVSTVRRDRGRIEFQVHYGL